MVMPAQSHPGLKYNYGAGTAYHRFEEALKSDQPIWVLNNSQPKAQLIITITDPLSGKPRTMEFHRTFVPFCLSDMVPRSVLEQSLEIRNFIRKGVLKLVTEDEAMKILSSDDGHREHERLNHSEYAEGNVLSARVKDMVSSTNLARQTAGISASDPSANLTVESLASLHPKIKAWESRVLVEDLNTQGLLSELRIHANEFTEADCQYLVNGKFPTEACDWAKEKLKSGDLATKAVSIPQSSRFDDSKYQPDYE